MSAPARSPGVATPLLGHRLAAEEVVISAEAWRDLSEQVRLDGLEEAGWLFGHHRGQQIRVEAVVLADQARTGSRVELDLAVLERMTEHYRRGPGWQPVGDFHSHVGAGYSNPSGNDRYAWRHAADRTNAAWLGLLLTPRSTWTLESTFDHGPAVDAYLTATGASETRRARLILET